MKVSVNVRGVARAKWNVRASREFGGTPDIRCARSTYLHAPTDEYVGRAERTLIAEIKLILERQQKKK